MGRGNFAGKGMSRHARRHSDVNSAKTAEPIEMPFGLRTRVDPRKHVLDGAQIMYAMGQLLKERTCPGMSDDILPSAVQKWLNRSICCLGCGLGYIGPKEAQVQSYSPTWRLGMNPPSTVAMRPYVKLL